MEKFVSPIEKSGRDCLHKNAPLFVFADDVAVIGTADGRNHRFFSERFEKTEREGRGMDNNRNTIYMIVTGEQEMKKAEI